MVEVSRSAEGAVREKGRQVAGLALFLVVTFAASFLGMLATNSSLGSWYDSLAKPDWTPPGAFIGAVWTVLYASMSVAVWLVWRQDGTRGSKRALTLYAVQLALNVGWSLLFFGLRSPGAALLEIVVLALAVAWTLIVFWRRVPIAGMLMLPYLAWVCFAGFLSFTIWRMNS